MDELRNQDTCKWTYDKWQEYWGTECGEAFYYSDGGPVENGQIYCHHCGRRVEIVEVLAEECDDGN